MERVGEPGGVGHQVVHGDRPGEGLGLERVRVTARVHPRLGECRDVLRDRVVELEPALLVEHQRRHRRDRLRHRVHAIDGVRLYRAVRLDVAAAAGLEPGEAVVAHDGDEQPREAARVHPPPHPGEDPGKARGREPDVLGPRVDVHVEFSGGGTAPRRAGRRGTQGRGGHRPAGAGRREWWGRRRTRTRERDREQGRAADGAARRGTDPTRP